MARKDRTGNRKTREQRQPLKIPELGYYLVVTDTEATERCYFQGLHKELPKDIQNKLVIKVVETKTRVMIDKVEGLLKKPEIRRTLSKKMRVLVDGGGCKRVVDMLNKFV